MVAPEKESQVILRPVKYQLRQSVLRDTSTNVIESSVEFWPSPLSGCLARMAQFAT